MRTLKESILSRAGLNNYKIIEDWCKENLLPGWKLNKDLTIDGNILFKSVTSMTDLYPPKGAQWNRINDFDCSFCNNLKSLKGAPKEVTHFNCSNCINLTSLEGAPEKVQKIFSCYNCKKAFTKKDVRKVSNVNGLIHT